MAFLTINILDLLKIVGEDKVKNVLSGFSCNRNKEIEEFVRNDAIVFSQKKMSITYLVLDEKSELAAIFTLAHKPIQIYSANLANRTKNKIERYAHHDDSIGAYVISAFLIAQFGKNSNYNGEELKGNFLMGLTEEIIMNVQREIGGGVVYLECENLDALLSFYQKEENGFRIFGERYSITDNTKYIQLFKFI